MKVVKFFLTFSIFALLIFNFKFSVFKSAHAADESSCQNPDNFSDCQKYIDQLNQQLNETRGQENTLKSQLDYIDGQAKLTQLKINSTNFEIDKLSKEIDDLSGRIDRLSSNVDQISGVLLDRIVQTYKLGNVTPIDLLFSSHGFSDLLERLKYVEVAQANDKKVLYQLQATKTAYNDQKNDKETRQTQQEKLKKDLNTYQTQLDQQKAQKAQLLKETQNSESVYQAKIQAALQEQAAILAILGGGGKEVADGPVHTNDIVGYMLPGQSPCSGGPHVHFEVHQGGNMQDPNNYLAPVSFQYVDGDGGKTGPINPHGTWQDWPVFPTITITQGYGMTPYATGALDGIKHYNGGPHTGIDMWSTSTTAVKAVHDGTKYTGEIDNVCTYPITGPLHYIRVDHGDGVSSYYLHVI